MKSSTALASAFLGVVAVVILVLVGSSNRSFDPVSRVRQPLPGVAMSATKQRALDPRAVEGALPSDASAKLGRIRYSAPSVAD